MNDQNEVTPDPELEDILSESSKEETVTDSGKDEITVGGETDDDYEDKKIDSGDDDKDPDEKELDTPTVYPRPKFKDVVAKYPAFFKDFPDLRQAFFREQKFTEIFPTIEEASAAAESADDYNTIVSDLQNGDIGNILGVLDKDQLKSVASAFLPELYGKDQDIYFSITGQILDSFLKNAFRAAENAGDEDLKASAQWLAKWAFGDFSYASGGKSVQPLNNKAENDGRKKLDEERKSYEEHKFVDNYNSITDAGIRGLRSTIMSGLSDVTSATLKNMIIKAVEDEVGEALDGDPSHVRRMDALWARARKAGFLGDSKTRILSTYLARAKSIVPAIRSRVKAEVLGQSVKTESLEKSTTSAPSGSPVRVNGSKLPTDPKKIDWRKTSDLDYIKGAATLRR